MRSNNRRGARLASAVVGDAALSAEVGNAMPDRCEAGFEHPVALNPDIRTPSRPVQLARQVRRHLRFQAGFSLVEVLASLFVLTISAVGITAAWRLADYQELLTRADRRAERILRQYYELQTFAPPDSRPFTVNSSPSPSEQNAITGYLYHPRLIAGQASSFGNLIPFTISMSNGSVPGTNQLVLTYTMPSYGTQASRQVTKTVILNP